jgi:hypothetical protein
MWAHILSLQLLLEAIDPLSARVHLQP